jgi:signal transduction histidine kinase
VAARSSGHGDTIEIRLQGAELDGARRGVELVVEPQSVPETRSSAVSGGIPDLRLTLARALMEAHGGRLEVEQRDGLSVHIAFPVERVVRAADAPRETAAVEATAPGNDDRVRDLPVS